jgi:acetyl esterase/lipase
MRRLLPLAALTATLLGPMLRALADEGSAPDRKQDVIYGRKHGTALTMDVFTPTEPNGLGLIFVVSGGWFSAHEAIGPGLIRPLTDRGYTVFAVVHGSQPKFTIPEILGDMHRAVRFLRHHAGDYGIDPDRLGIYGGSAGGHLSLMQGLAGEIGDPKAKDPVDRESSEVQCVACFFPPTDFLNYSRPGEDGVGFGILKGFKAAFGPRADVPEERQKLGREISPIYFIHSNQPPILIIHGDADTLVPIYQSRTFVKRCQEVGATAKLVEREGKNHGWPEMGKDLEVFADWFDEHLRGQLKSEGRPKAEAGPK